MFSELLMSSVESFSKESRIYNTFFTADSYLTGLSSAVS